MSGSSEGAPPVRLARSMHGFGALLITLTALSPSIGLFVVGSEVLHQAGTGTFLCFAAAALLGVAMACVYGELGSAFPDTGGEYTLVGRAMGPAWGFAMLGTTLIGISIAPALLGLGTMDYLAVLNPDLPRVPVAIGLVVIVTLIAILNIRLNALVTGICLAVELLALGAVAVLGLSHPHQELAVALHPVVASAQGLIPTPIAIMGVGVVSGIYAFNGYGSVIYMGEELHQAPQRLAKVVFWALGLAVVAELVPLGAILIGAPDLQALTASKEPIPYFLETLGGQRVAEVMSLGVALAFFNTMIAVALMAGRLLYASGRDRVWPEAFSRLIERVHPTLGSPWIATLFMGATSVAWCLAPKSLVLTILAFGNVAMYAALCLATLSGRRTGATDHAGWRMPLFPLAPIVGLVTLAGVTWSGLADPKTGQKGLFATVAVIAVSVAYYWLFLRGKGRWAHRGPAGDEAP